MELKQRTVELLESISFGADSTNATQYLTLFFNTESRVTKVLKIYLPRKIAKSSE